MGLGWPWQFSGTTTYPQIWRRKDVIQAEGKEERSRQMDQQVQRPRGREWVGKDMDQKRTWGWRTENPLLPLKRPRGMQCEQRPQRQLFKV